MTWKEKLNCMTTLFLGYIAVVPTQKGNKNELGMSGRVYFNVFNKIFFLLSIGFEHATDRSPQQIELYR